MTDSGENKPNDASAASPPKTPKRRRAPAPIEPVSTGFSSFTPSTREPKPTHIPDLPPYYANALKRQTELILVEASRKFPDQARTLEMCKYIISELTPHLRAAVQHGTVPADLALSDSREVLRSVLICNDAGQFEQEVRKSDEWLGLVKAIAESPSAQEPQHEARAKARGESHFTKAVRNALIRAPGATGLEICRSIDDDGVKTDVPFEEKYTGDAKQRKLLDSRFSKTRNKMRKEGLLPR